jgi:hypothetical protein
LKGNRSFWLGMAVLAALITVSTIFPTGFFGAAAHAQVISPPPNPHLPPPEPLAGVKYNYPWEIYGGIGYAATDAGPNVLQQALLGGFDSRAVREFSQHWGVGANVRGYFGTSGVGATTSGAAGQIHGPFVAEYFLLGGPEYRVLSDEHAAMLLHTFVGGVYGDFQHGLNGVPPADVGFFSNQMALGMALGGSIDLNRSPRLVFRIAPDALMSDFGGNGLAEHMSLSIGVVYRLGHQFRVK